jgi:hypothetical protein
LVLRRLTGLLLAAVVTVGLGSLSASAARHAGGLRRDQQSTVVRVYRPFEGTRINPTLHVRRRVKGFCWTGSEAAFRRRDAWRCTWGRFIVDPCFAGPNRSIHYVLCPDEAWNNGVMRLQLNRPLPTHSENKQKLGSVWAIVTTSGLRCRRGSGQIPLVAGKPLLYDCGRAGDLAGEPNTARPLWTIFFSAAAHPKRLSPTGIATAWR